jgi:CBS domain-containing protein
MTTAADIMTSQVHCVGERQTLAEAAAMMRDLDVGALPICGEDGRLHGIITDRDIVLKCVAAGLDPSACTAAELAQGKPHYVLDDTDMSDVLQAMEDNRIRRMPVIGHDDHSLVGMISEADVARNLEPGQLAEFVESITQG